MTEPVASPLDRLWVALHLKYPPLGQGPTLEQRRARQRRVGPTVMALSGGLTLLGTLDTLLGVAERNGLLVVLGLVVVWPSYFAFRHWRSVVRSLKEPDPVDKGRGRRRGPTRRPRR